ncbi:unnamed protein product, partial [Ectocarpus sp. 6 AP-2014]
DRDKTSLWPILSGVSVSAAVQRHHFPTGTESAVLRVDVVQQLRSPGGGNARRPTPGRSKLRTTAAAAWRPSLGHYLARWPAATTAAATDVR